MYYREKYKPELLSELEIEYPKIKEFLDKKIKFIVTGPKECGKTTIIKLYLKLLNYEYLIIDDYNEESNISINKLNNACNNPLTYFNNNKFIIVIDNFEYFELKFKQLVLKSKLPLLIIIKNYLNIKINYIYIKNYSQDYISNLYNNICFLESKNIKKTNYSNINKMFTLLENNSNNTIYDVFLYNYNDYLKIKNLNKKLYIISKLKYIDFQINIIYNINDIYILDKCYEYLLNSIKYINFNDYYEILCFLGCGQFIKTDFKINCKYKQIVKQKTDLWIPNILKNKIKKNVINNNVN